MREIEVGGNPSTIPGDGEVASMCLCFADGGWKKFFSNEGPVEGGLGTLADLRSETKIISAFLVLL